MQNKLSFDSSVAVPSDGKLTPLYSGAQSLSTHPSFRDGWDPLASKTSQNPPPPNGRFFYLSITSKRPFISLLNRNCSRRLRSVTPENRWEENIIDDQMSCANDILHHSTQSNLIDRTVKSKDGRFLSTRALKQTPSCSSTICRHQTLQ